MKNLSTSAFLFLTLSFMVSCDKASLSRNKAEGILREQLKAPYAVSFSSIGGTFYERQYPALKKLEDAGLVTLKETTIYWGVGGNLSPAGDRKWESRLTDKGKEFVIDGNKFLSHVEDIKEVTGIKFEDEKKTKATIEYIAVATYISPFIVFVGEIYPDRNIKVGDVKEKKCEVELYDDGWRIVGDKKPNGWSGSGEKYIDLLK